MTSQKNTSPVPDGLSPQPCRFGTLSSSTSAEDVMTNDKHLLNPWGILRKKGGGFRLSKRWLSCSFGNLVLGDSKKTCLKVSFIFNVAKQLRKTVSWIAISALAACIRWASSASLGKSSIWKWTKLRACILFGCLLYDDKTQPQQPQQTHAQHTTVTTTITVTHPTDSCLITDHWSFTAFQPAVSERAWHIHALFQSPSPETAVSSSRQQVDQQKVAKYICNASRDGSKLWHPERDHRFGNKILSQWSLGSQLGGWCFFHVLQQLSLHLNDQLIWDLPSKGWYAGVPVTKDDHLEYYRDLSFLPLLFWVDKLDEVYFNRRVVTVQLFVWNGTLWKGEWKSGPKIAANQEVVKIATFTSVLSAAFYRLW